MRCYGHASGRRVERLSATVDALKHRGSGGGGYPAGRREVLAQVRHADAVRFCGNVVEEKARVAYARVGSVAGDACAERIFAVNLHTPRTPGAAVGEGFSSFLPLFSPNLHIPLQVLNFSSKT